MGMNTDTGLDTGGLLDVILGDITRDFETGDTSEWQVNDLSASTSRVYEGTYSGYCGTAQGTTYQARTQVAEGGLKADKFTFYFNETGTSYGSGVRFLNSNGNWEAGAGTNNPDWMVWDGNGFSHPGGSGDYDVWTKVEFTFDWGAGVFDIYMENLSTGGSWSDTGRPLRNGTDLEYIYIEDYSNSTWRDGGNIKVYHDYFVVS